MNDESNFIFNQKVRPYVLNLNIDNTCADYSGGIKKSYYGCKSASERK